MEVWLWNILQSSTLQYNSLFKFSKSIFLFQFPFGTRHSRGIYFFSLKNLSQSGHTRRCTKRISSFRLFLSTEYLLQTFIESWAPSIFLRLSLKLILSWKPRELSKLPLSRNAYYNRGADRIFHTGSPIPYLRIFFSDSIDFSLFQRESWNCNAVRGLGRLAYIFSLSFPREQINIPTVSQTLPGPIYPVVIQFLLSCARFSTRQISYRLSSFKWLTPYCCSVRKITHNNIFLWWNSFCHSRARKWKLVEN